MKIVFDQFYCGTNYVQINNQLIHVWEIKIKCIELLCLTLCKLYIFCYFN